MYSKTFSTAVVATLLSATNAHFFISNPTPIPGSAPKDPLDASGANFPCHGADLTQGTVTNLQVGQTYPLQFDLGQGANTAVHGGGSCQLSVAYSTDATQLKNPANWKVITSFVGGCPTNAMGNLPTAVMCPQNAPQCVNQFNFTVPSEVQNGNAIFAWTWFNNVGNREMYMNCAKVSISGGQNQLNSLPSMMVANLASINQCKTTEDFNTNFPDPGKYVVQASTMNYPLKAPQGTGCGSGSGVAAGSGSTGSSSGSSGSGSSAAAGGSGTSATSSANNGQYTGVGAQTTSAAAPKASASNSGGVFAPGASSAAAAQPTTLATSVATTPAAGSSATASAASSPAASGSPAGAISGNCQNGAVACTASGFYCIDAQHYGECAFGCAVPMAMAAGTTCTNNAVAAMVVPGKSFRPRGVRRHVHRRHIGDSN